MKLSFRQGALFEAYKSKPVINFSKQSIEASIELRSLASEYFIKKIDPTDVEAWGVDEDMYSGLRIKQSGIDLITYDLDTQEFRFFDKKAIEEGDFVRSADGRVHITDDFLDRSNQVDARYAPEIDPENPKLSKVYYEKFMKTMSAADDKHKQRNNDHFTLFRGKITDLPEELRTSVNIDTHTEVYTNRTLYYVIDQDKKGTYSLNYYVPTWRDGESFIPAPLHDPLSIRRVKHSLGKGLAYIDAVDQLQEHWQGVISHDVRIDRDVNGALDVGDRQSDLQGKSEVLFEEEHNLCDGALTKTWYKAVRAGRYPFENPRMLLAAGFVAAVYGVVGEKPLLGLGLGAALEIAGHRFADFYSDKTRYDKARKKTPRQYGGKNTADISNKGNITKNKSKPDKGKIVASRNVVLNFDQRNCITNPRMAPIEMNPASLKHFIVNVGGMGVSSTAELPHGTDIEQRVYNTGLVRTKVKLDDDRHVYFARYRSDVVKNPDKQDMPEMYKEQIGDEICAVYRSRELVGDRYVTSLKIEKGLSLDKASDALNKLLDNEKFKFSDRGRAEFVASFQAQFDRPNYNYLDYGEEMDRSKVLYMSGRVSRPVDTQAVIQPM